MRIAFYSSFFAFFCLHVNSQSIWKHGRLKVTADGHYLQFEDGTPFFWLGDTGWELFHRLKKEEINTYLENRSKKGFNVIQAVILAEFDGLKKPNQYGEMPLIDLDPTKTNEKYFELIDYTVQLAYKKIYSWVFCQPGVIKSQRSGEKGLLFLMKATHMYMENGWGIATKIIRTSSGY